MPNGNFLHLRGSEGKGVKGKWMMGKGGEGRGRGRGERMRRSEGEVKGSEEK